MTEANCTARMKRSKLLLKKFLQFVVVLFIIFFFYGSERIIVKIGKDLTELKLIK